MQILEKIIAYIAPHYCTECGAEGKLLCALCAKELFGKPHFVCGLCGQPTSESEVCATCRAHTVLSHVWSLGGHTGALERLVRALKFEGAREAADVLAEALDGILPPLPPATVIIPMPTAPRRVRQRSYDQSVLIARRLACLRQLPYAPLLRRTHNARQLGATRQQRLKQAATAYKVRHTRAMPPYALLVDDVVTTGGSINAAAQILHAAGCHNVRAAVAARHY